MTTVIVRMGALGRTVTFYDRNPPEVVDIEALSPPDRQYIPHEIFERVAKHKGSGKL